MLLLKRNTFEIESDSPRVSAEDVATMAQVQDIVAAAQSEAAGIVAEARKAYEDEKNRGYADGLAAGREEILMQKLDLIDESVKFMERVETRMGDLVVKALRKCVAEIGDRELVVQIVRKSMQAIVRNQRQITVKVSTDMVPVVKARAAEIQADFPSLAFIEVVEDPHLENTACVVETEAGSVEASIDGQLAAIEKSIRKNLSREV